MSATGKANGGGMASAKGPRYARRMLRVVTVDKRAPDRAAVLEAARVLAAGGLVAIPTETVYGLGARACDEAAIARVYAAKGRPRHHPLIAHVTGEAQARALAASWPERAARLADAFWPGPLTIVVDRAKEVAAAIAGGGDSIAVRAPSHAVAHAVIEALGEAVAAPSANRFQGLSPTTAAHVVKQLGNAVDLVLDAGPCDAGIESTVVDVRGARVRVLRPGAILGSALREALGEAVNEGDRVVEAVEPRASPGMGARHYAPRARLVIAETRAGAERLAADLRAQGKRVGVLAIDHRDAAEYARRFYADLHDLDDAGVDVIVVERVPNDEAWWAIADRLRRAAT